MSTQLLLEIAFAYADSGKARSLDDVRRHLLDRGFTHAEVRQISGAALSHQIRARIETAMTRETKQPA